MTIAPSHWQQWGTVESRKKCGHLPPSVCNSIKKRIFERVAVHIFFLVFLYQHFKSRSARQKKKNNQQSTSLISKTTPPLSALSSSRSPFCPYHPLALSHARQNPCPHRYQYQCQCKRKCSSPLRRPIVVLLQAHISPCDLLPPPPPPIHPPRTPSHRRRRKPNPRLHRPPRNAHNPVWRRIPRNPLALRIRHPKRYSLLQILLHQPASPRRLREPLVALRHRPPQIL